MKKLTKKLNILTLPVILSVMFLCLFVFSAVKANAYDGGFDSGYGSYDSGYGSGYGSYDSGYGSGYGSYYGGYDNTCYDCGSSYYGGYDNTCYDCGYTPPCTTCNYVPPVVVIPTLIVSCTPNRYDVDKHESVTWTANASGGSGSFSYSWSGTGGLSGSGRQISQVYNSTGSKTAHVVVTSGGRTATADCGSVYVNDDYRPYNYRDLNVSCTVNNNSLTIGQTAVWNTSVSGGNGSYYYSWTGTDGLYGNSSTISRNFNTLGAKYATVTVTSDGQSKTLTCPNVVVGGLAYPNPGVPASLSSVYLNQVPYTGVGDNPKFIAFIVSLLVFSAFGAYAIVYRKTKIERKNKILDFKNENMLNRIRN